MKGEVRRSPLLNLFKINVITYGAALLRACGPVGLLRLFLRLLHLLLGLAELIPHRLGCSANGQNNVKHQPVGHVQKDGVKNILSHFANLVLVPGLIC